MYENLQTGNLWKPLPTSTCAKEILGSLSLQDCPQAKLWDHQRLQNENFGKLLPTKASNTETLGSPSLQNLKTQGLSKFGDDFGDDFGDNKNDNKSKTYLILDFQCVAG